MNKLTEQEKNNLIAKSLGWKFDGKSWTYPNGGSYDGGHYMLPVYPPSYFLDLNACHEMEEAKSLNVDRENQPLSFKYWHNILDVITKTKAINNVHCATAAQRAEAYGLAKNLWEEGQ